MTGAYIVELNIVGVCFGFALFGFLRALRGDESALRPLFLRLVGAGVLLCAAEAAWGFLANFYAGPRGAGILRAAFAVVIATDLINAICFFRYASGFFREKKEQGEVPRGAYVVFSLFLALPVAAVLIRRLWFPWLLMTGFSVMFSDYLIYLFFETPPYRQLALRMQELSAATARAEEAREEALKEDRATNEFLANMSHEIRTPLTAILGYDEIVLRDAAEEDVREYASDIRAAGQTLLYIINDILDFSKIESGETTLSDAPYHLSQVLDNIDNMIRKKAQDKGLEYRRVIDLNLPDHLSGDDVRVNQILLNLLNNAVKYTEQGYVELRVRGDRPEGDDRRILLRVDVTDSGIGIREEDLPKLFQSFTRLEQERNRQVEGTGLGLAITARLLDLMGGTIDIRSRYGEGSTFSVTIPQRIEHEGTLQEYAAHALQREQDDERMLIPDARILVTDDNETNRTVVAELLRHTLAQVDTADSGEQCLTMVRETPYDLILLDQMMPNMSGPQTLKRMKTMSDNRSADAVVVAFTADVIAGARDRLLSEGFDDYLAKPVTGDDLTELLERHLPPDKILRTRSCGRGRNPIRSRARRATRCFSGKKRARTRRFWNDSGGSTSRRRWRSAAARRCCSPRCVIFI